MLEHDTAVRLAFFIFLLTLSFGAMWSARVGGREQRRASYDSVLAAYSPTLTKVRPGQTADLDTALDRIGNRLISPRYRRLLRNRLVSTGRQDLSAYRILVRRKVLGLGVGLAYGGYIELDGTAMGFLKFLAATGGGFMIPDLLTYNTGTKRAMALDKALPDAIDILNLCVESGLTLQAAMAQVSNILQGPVSQEFARVLRQMQLGQPMNQSLLDMSARNNNPDLDRLVTVIVQSERLGIPIGTVLNEQAREMRLRRRDRAREQAQKVPVKILMPVMLCFLPGIFIVVLGPALVSIMDGLGG
jgi:tight adherence protein C